MFGCLRLMLLPHAKYLFNLPFQLIRRRKRSTFVIAPICHKSYMPLKNNRCSHESAKKKVQQMKEQQSDTNKKPCFYLIEPFLGKD